MAPASIRLTDRALIGVNHPWTSTPVINATVTTNEIDRRLFSDNTAPSMGALFFNADPNQAVCFFLDPSWNRVVFGNKSEEWIRSYGEWHGPPRNEYYLAGPRALAVDAIPNNYVYVADTENDRIVKLNYGVGYMINVATFHDSRMMHPVDITLSFMGDYLWIADDYSGKILRMDRSGGFPGAAIENYRIGTQTIQIRRPSNVCADNSFLGERLGLVDGATNTFVLGDLSQVSGNTITAFASTVFNQPGSRLASIGVDMNENWWVTDPGLGMIHVFDIFGEYLGSVNQPTIPQRISTSPYYRDGQSLLQVPYIYTAEQWNNDKGLRTAFPGADVIDMQVQDAGSVFRLSSVLTNTCEINVKVIRASDGTLVQTIFSGYSFANPHRTDDVSKSSLAYGTYRFQVEVKPFHNDLYGGNAVDWLVRTSPPFTHNGNVLLYSSSMEATATNNQRKIAQSDNGTYCMVYESGDQIFFSKSLDGANWLDVFQVSNVSPTPRNRYPSIVVKDNVANVVWQSTDQSCYIYLRRYDMGSNTWGPLEAIAQFPVDNPDFVATPVIDADNLSFDDSNDWKTVTWRDGYDLKIKNFWNGTVGQVTSVPGSHGNCFFPSIAVHGSGYYALCWQDASAEAIKYVECLSSGATWSFGNAAQISPYGWYMNQRPSIGLWLGDFVCSSSKITVAWQSVDNVVEGVSVHVRATDFGCNNWGAITSYSMSTGGVKPHPSIGTFMASRQQTLMWNSFDEVFYAAYDGSTWNPPKQIAGTNDGGRECNISFSWPSDQIAIWRTPSGQIATYQNPGGFSARDGSLSMNGEPVRYRRNRHGIVRVNQALGHGNGRVDGMMAFEIARMTLTTSRGIDTLEFSEVAATNKSLLSSKPFRVQANTTLNFAGAAYGKRLAVPRDSMRTITQPIARVVLRQRGSSTVRKEIWTIPFSDIASMRDSTYGTFRSFDVDLNDIVGRDVFVDVEMLGRGRVEPLIDDDYLIMPRTPGSPYGSPLGKSAEKTIPISYGLYQNYPNPFNPSTVIRFDLPEAQVVSVKVFNVLGQEVMTVASGLHEAGEHSVTADFSNLPTGMYIYRMNAGKFSDVKKLLVVK
jgi:hypothetical protein